MCFIAHLHQLRGYLHLKIQNYIVKNINENKFEIEIDYPVIAILEDFGDKSSNFHIFREVNDISTPQDCIKILIQIYLDFSVIIYRELFVQISNFYPLQGPVYMHKMIKFV